MGLEKFESHSIYWRQKWQKKSADQLPEEIVWIAVGTGVKLMLKRQTLLALQRIESYGEQSEETPHLEFEDNVNCFASSGVISYFDILNVISCFDIFNVINCFVYELLYLTC